MNPRRLYRLLARAEAVTWTLLLLGMVLKYVTGTTDLLVRVGGGVHGLVFLSYCVATILVGVDRRWPAPTLLGGLASSVVPYLTVPFERRAERRGLLAVRWRLRAESPTGALERLAATALRRPLPSALTAAVLVVLVFGVLLSLGPPTQWGS